MIDDAKVVSEWCIKKVAPELRKRLSIFNVELKFDSIGGVSVWLQRRGKVLAYSAYYPTFEAAFLAAAAAAIRNMGDD